MKSFLFFLIFHESFNPFGGDVIDTLQAGTVIRCGHVNFIIIVFGDIVGPLDCFGQLFRPELLEHGLVLVTGICVLGLHDAHFLERFDGFLHLVEGSLGLSTPVVAFYVLFVEFNSLASVWEQKLESVFYLPKSAIDEFSNLRFANDRLQ